MRKILPLLLLTSFVSIAQSREKSSIEITPKVGYSNFILRDDSGNHSNSLGSVNFGVTGDYYFNNRWSLRSGLMFQTMGGTNNGVNDKLNYLNVPINANWHFGSTRKWNLNFGLTPSFLMSAKEDGPNLLSSDIGDNDPNPNSNDIYGMVQNAQLGLSVGIGYKLEITNRFGLLFDYQEFYGLTNTARMSGVVIKNSGYSLNLGGVFLL